MAPGSHDVEGVLDLLLDELGQARSPSLRPIYLSALEVSLQHRGLTAAAQLDALRGPRRRAEVAALVHCVTIPYTRFFRVRRQMAWIAECWIPAAVASRRASGEQTLAVWSAGCSTGQELWSVGMLLLDHLGETAPDWEIALVGRDLRPSAVARARAGEYTAEECRSAPEPQRGRYLQDGVVRPDLHRLARFEVGDLRDPAPTGPPFDLVLCSNVLIYLGPDAVRAALGQMETALRPQGRLALGAIDLALAQDQRRLHLDGELAAFQPCGSSAHPELDLPDAVDVLISRGDHQRAIREVHRRAMQHGLSPELVEQKARACIGLGQLDEARALIDDARRLAAQLTPPLGPADLVGE